MKLPAERSPRERVLTEINALLSEIRHSRIL